MEVTELKAIFSARVAALAEDRGLSINRLADFAGVSRGYLSDVLRQTKAPTLRTIARLAEALDVEPWELLRPTPPRRRKSS
jgi:transcriptional regulator with XRE-family HTH domain